MPEMNDPFSKTVALLRSFPQKGDDELHRMLVTDGVDSSFAGKLLLLLPMVYCRILFADSGAKFAETYCWRLPDGRISAEQPLSSEPIWGAAFGFARTEVERGVSPSDLIAVAGRSAEFDAANKLCNGGSNLKDVVFTAPILNLPSDWLRK